MFITFSRPFFLIGLMMIMTCMILEQGRLLRNVFSASFWVPLSRLSYVVYLIFPLINARLISSMQQSLYLSYLTMFYLLAFNFVFCMLAAFLANIFIEAPLYNLMISRQIRTRDREEKFLHNLKLFYAKGVTNNSKEPSGSQSPILSESTRQKQSLIDKQS